jgi:hypothetical protein
MTKLSWQTWQKWAAGAVALVLLVDVGLIAFLWSNSRQDRGDLAAERHRLSAEAKLLQADVNRGEGIRQSLPAVGKESDGFYRESFLDGSTGYSEIESDLGGIAAKSGVHTSGFTFKQTPIANRGVTEISIATSVAADYPAIIQFINGLERSKNFYLLDNLRLASAAPGSIHLDLALHTYFRN